MRFTPYPIIYNILNYNKITQEKKPFHKGTALVFNLKFSHTVHLASLHV